MACQLLFLTAVALIIPNQYSASVVTANYSTHNESAQKVELDKVNVMDYIKKGIYSNNEERGAEENLSDLNNVNPSGKLREKDHQYSGKHSFNAEKHVMVNIPNETGPHDSGIVKSEFTTGRDIVLDEEDLPIPIGDNAIDRILNINGRIDKDVKTGNSLKTLSHISQTGDPHKDNKPSSSDTILPEQALLESELGPGNLFQHRDKNVPDSREGNFLMSALNNSAIKESRRPHENSTDKQINKARGETIKSRVAINPGAPGQRNYNSSTSDNMMKLKFETLNNDSDSDGNVHLNKSFERQVSSRTNEATELKLTEKINNKKVKTKPLTVQHNPIKLVKQIDSNLQNASFDNEHININKELVQQTHHSEEINRDIKQNPSKYSIHNDAELNITNKRQVAINNFSTTTETNNITETTPRISNIMDISSDLFNKSALPPIYPSITTSGFTKKNVSNSTSTLDNNTSIISINFTNTNLSLTYDKNNLKGKENVVNNESSNIEEIMTEMTSLRFKEQLPTNDKSNTNSMLNTDINSTKNNSYKTEVIPKIRKPEGNVSIDDSERRKIEANSNVLNPIEKIILSHVKYNKNISTINDNAEKSFKGNNTKLMQISENRKISTIDDVPTKNIIDNNTITILNKDLDDNKSKLLRENFPINSVENIQHNKSLTNTIKNVILTDFFKGKHIIPNSTLVIDEEEKNRLEKPPNITNFETIGKYYYKNESINQNAYVNQTLEDLYSSPKQTIGNFVSSKAAKNIALAVKQIENNQDAIRTFELARTEKPMLNIYSEKDNQRNKQFPYKIRALINLNSTNEEPKTFSKLDRIKTQKYNSVEIRANSINTTHSDILLNLDIIKTSNNDNNQFNAKIATTESNIEATTTLPEDYINSNIPKHRKKIDDMALKANTTNQKGSNNIFSVDDQKNILYIAGNEIMSSLESNPTGSDNTEVDLKNDNQTILQLDKGQPTDSNNTEIDLKNDNQTFLQLDKGHEGLDVQIRRNDKNLAFPKNYSTRKPNKENLKISTPSHKPHIRLNFTKTIDIFSEPKVQELNRHESIGPLQNKSTLKSLEKLSKPYTNSNDLMTDSLIESSNKEKNSSDLQSVATSDEFHSTKLNASIEIKPNENDLNKRNKLENDLPEVNATKDNGTLSKKSRILIRTNTSSNKSEVYLEPNTSKNVQTSLVYENEHRKKSEPLINDEKISKFNNTFRFNLTNTNANNTILDDKIKEIMETYDSKVEIRDMNKNGAFLSNPKFTSFDNTTTTEKYFYNNLDKMDDGNETLNLKSLLDYKMIRARKNHTKIPVNILITEDKPQYSLKNSSFHDSHIKTKIQNNITNLLEETMGPITDNHVYTGKNITNILTDKESRRKIIDKSFDRKEINGKRRNIISSGNSTNYKNNSINVAKHISYKTSNFAENNNTVITKSINKLRENALEINLNNSSGFLRNKNVTLNYNTSSTSIKQFTIFNIVTHLNNGTHSLNKNDYTDEPLLTTNESTIKKIKLLKNNVLSDFIKNSTNMTKTVIMVEESKPHPTDLSVTTKESKNGNSLRARLITSTVSTDKINIIDPQLSFQDFKIKTNTNAPLFRIGKNNRLMELIVSGHKTKPAMIKRSRSLMSPRPSDPYNDMSTLASSASWRTTSVSPSLERVTNLLRDQTGNYTTNGSDYKVPLFPPATKPTELSPTIDSDHVVQSADSLQSVGVELPEDNSEEKQINLNFPDTSTTPNKFDSGGGDCRNCSEENAENRRSEATVMAETAAANLTIPPKVSPSLPNESLFTASTFNISALPDGLQDYLTTDAPSATDGVLLMTPLLEGDNASPNSTIKFTNWPVKKEAVVEGDIVLGGLMMVHEREDSITCGPVMPQGGIQALEAMLYTLDRLNEEQNQLLPNITLGAHILDDCDKDTYGLEMAVDFIKGINLWNSRTDETFLLCISPGAFFYGKRTQSFISKENLYTD